MRKLKYSLDRKSLEVIYLSFIRPILEYANEIWDNCTLYEKQELNKIQNEAARIATGATKLVSIKTLYKETGWDTLDNRRRKQKLILFHKMVNHSVPDYLSSLVPNTVSESSQYSLRNSNDIRTIRCQSQIYSTSFFYHRLYQSGTLFLKMFEHRICHPLKIT
jgi:hypothetical protein